MGGGWQGEGKAVAAVGAEATPLQMTTTSWKTYTSRRGEGKAGNACLTHKQLWGLTGVAAEHVWVGWDGEPEG